MFMMGDDEQLDFLLLLSFRKIPVGFGQHEVERSEMIFQAATSALISGAKILLNECREKCAQAESNSFFHSALLVCVKWAKGGVDQNGAHTRINICTTMRAIASDCTVLFHGCKMTMGVQSAREIHYSPFCWPPPAAAAGFSGRFCCCCTQLWRCGASFLLSWGIQLIFFTFNGN